MILIYVKLIKIWMEFGKTSDFECNSAMQKLKMPTLRNTSAIVLSATDDSFASNCWKISLVLLTSMSQDCLIKIQKSTASADATAIVVASFVAKMGMNKRVITVPTNTARESRYRSVSFFFNITQAS